MAAGVLAKRLLRQRGVIAGGLDGADQIVDRGLRGVEGNRRLLGRVVDGRLDALQLVEALLDPGRTGGAGHPLELELDPAPIDRAPLRDLGHHAAS